MVAVAPKTPGRMVMQAQMVVPVHLVLQELMVIRPETVSQDRQVNQVMLGKMVR